MNSIQISWTVKTVNDSSRINSMYCFKSCERNQN